MRMLLRADQTLFDNLRHWVRIFLIVLKTQFFLFRTAWIWYLILMALQPLTLVIFLSLFATAADEMTIFYIISGNIVLSLTLSGMLSLGQELGWMKADNSLSYYATLPVPKSALIFAIVTRSIFLSFLPVILILGISQILFDITIHYNIELVIVIVVSSYSMAGLGAFIGFYSPNGRTSNMLTQIIQPLIVFLSPVFVPVERLPDVLQSVAFVLPTTYVAEALRDALSNTVDSDTWLYIFLLAALTCFTLVFVDRALRWSRG